MLLSKVQRRLHDRFIVSRLSSSLKIVESIATSLLFDRLRVWSCLRLLVVPYGIEVKWHDDKFSKIKLSKPLKTSLAKVREVPSDILRRLVNVLPTSWKVVSFDNPKWISIIWLVLPVFNRFFSSVIRRSTLTRSAVIHKFFSLYRCFHNSLKCVKSYC